MPFVARLLFTPHWSMKLNAQRRPVFVGLWKSRGQVHVPYWSVTYPLGISIAHICGGDLEVVPRCICQEHFQRYVVHNGRCRRHLRVITGFVALIHQFPLNLQISSVDVVTRFEGIPAGQSACCRIKLEPAGSDGPSNWNPSISWNGYWHELVSCLKDGIERRTFSLQPFFALR